MDPILTKKRKYTKIRSDSLIQVDYSFSFIFSLENKGIDMRNLGEEVVEGWWVG